MFVKLPLSGNSFELSLRDVMRPHKENQTVIMNFNYDTKSIILTMNFEEHKKLTGLRFELVSLCVIIVYK